MDYIQFRRVYHDDLLHFGIKLRSGRYPWGSGERPYQSDAKRVIDKAVRRTDKRNDPKNIALQGSVKNRIASNVKNSHNMFGEKSESIKKMNDELNNKIYDASRSSVSETRKAIQDPNFQKQFEDYQKKKKLHL